MSRWRELCREPFRLLFPLSLLFGLLGVNHWLCYAVGWLPSYSGLIHASIQLQTYLFGFILGFLLTALPRFTASAPATSAELLLILSLLIAQAGLLLAGLWLAAESCFIGLLVMLAVFAARRARTRRSSGSPPAEFVWIPLSLFYGVAGAGLLIAGQTGRLPSWLFRLAQPLAQQASVLGIVIGVSGFMGPRLLGRALHAMPPDLTPHHARRIRRRRIAWHLLAAVTFGASFLVEGLGVTGIAYTLRAAVITAELVWTVKLWPPPAAPDLYVKYVWAALWMIVLGLWGAGLAPTHRVVMLHLVFLGGMSLMVFAVSTMVVLSHAGEAARLRQPSWPLRLMGFGVAGALLTRVAAEWSPERFFPLLAAAAICWDVSAISWFVLALPRVWRAIPDGAFERMHEEAKRQFLKTAPSSETVC